MNAESAGELLGNVACDDLLTLSCRTIHLTKASGN
jgi:hypothetical protein